MSSMGELQACPGVAAVYDRVPVQLAHDEDHLYRAACVRRGQCVRAI